MRDNTTHSAFTILSQRGAAILRLMAGPTQYTLQEFGSDGCQRIELDTDELRAFLRALPPQLLADALVARNAVDLLTADLRQLMADATHDPCPDPDMCPGCEAACLISQQRLDVDRYRRGCKALGEESDTLPEPLLRLDNGQDALDVGIDFLRRRLGDTRPPCGER